MICSYGTTSNWHKSITFVDRCGVRLCKANNNVNDCPQQGRRIGLNHIKPCEMIMKINVKRLHSCQTNYVLLMSCLIFPFSFFIYPLLIIYFILSEGSAFSTLRFCQEEISLFSIA